MSEEFDSIVDRVFQQMWDFSPSLASGSGLHEYDGHLPDVSSGAMALRAAEVESELTALAAIQASSLGSQDRFDHSLLTSTLRKEIFELTEIRTHATNPIEMMFHIELSNYITRDYAPLAQRVESLSRALTAVPTFLDRLKAGLSPQLGLAVIEPSIEAYEGLRAFYDTDLAEAVAKLGDNQLSQSFEDARRPASAAVGAFVEHLEARRSSAGDEFAIGADRFAAHLLHGEMVHMPLDRLLAVGVADLERNLNRFREAAAAIDASNSPSEVMGKMSRHHPTADSLIPETADMLERIRAFVIDRDIVTVPSEIRCQVIETPSFMRWATAALDMPGPFEERATETYYYVTPVEPHWTPDQAEEWLSNMNYATLENTSVHEAYPGHYVHYLHTRSAPSKVSKMFGAYSFWEGWAHYTEEMMIEEGFADENPGLRLGQISDALLRDCRYVCAIRMHTEGMSVEEATRFFKENAYMEELPARKEATRGTFDPMYLNYTLGKLMIMKLREDYRREQGTAYSLKRFHDAFLSFGAPPIPLVRQMMLREPGEQVL